MLTRRDTFRLLGLAALATTVPGLAACGSDRGADPGDGIEMVSSDVRRSPGDPAAIGGVVGALHALTGGLYAQLAGDVADPGNLALSPYSVAVALAMTANGAAGKTATEMSGVLGTGAAGLTVYNAGLNALTQAVEGLAGSFDRGDGEPAVIALDSANALFGDRSVSWRAPFIDLLAESYGAGLRAVDFAHDAEGARKAVNSWTAGRTHDRIPQILGPGTVSDLTRLVLVNALYFKAPWAAQFDTSSTSDEPFHRPDGSTVSVPTMHGVMDVGGFGRGEGLVAVRLPYYSGTLAMTLLVPDEGGLPELEAAVGGGGLGDLLALPAPASVRLALPRWTFRTEAGLNDALAALGMPTAFGDLADFGPMADEEALHIGTVAHQVFVAVDEEGTEAAAATAVAMTEATSVPDYVEVTVDRPFLFVIHDVEHGTPLFVGRVADPSA